MGRGKFVRDHLPVGEGDRCERCGVAPEKHRDGMADHAAQRELGSQALICSFRTSDGRRCGRRIKVSHGYGFYRVEHVRLPGDPKRRRS